MFWLLLRPTFVLKQECFNLMNLISPYNITPESYIGHENKGNDHQLKKFLNLKLEEYK